MQNVVEGQVIEERSVPGLVSNAAGAHVPALTPPDRIMPVPELLDPTPTHSNADGHVTAFNLDSPGGVVTVNHVLPVPGYERRDAVGVPAASPFWVKAVSG